MTIITIKIHDETPAVWLEMPYAGIKGNNSHDSNLKRLVNPNNEMKTKMQKTKLNALTNVKVSCPGCKSTHIGKTDRTRQQQINERAPSMKKKLPSITSSIRVRN